MAAVPLSSLLIFTNQFSAMIQSQLPLVDVLDNLAMETPHRRLQSAVTAVVEDVEHGQELGDALSYHPDVFDQIYVNVVRAGMGSGRLDEALAQLSVHLTKADIVSKKMRGAMFYPMVVMAIALVAFNAVVFFILPKFQTMFASMSKDLPAITQLLIDVGEVWRANWLIIFGLVLFIVILIGVWLATPEGRYVWDQKKLDLPVVGKLWRMGALTKFLRTLAVQMRNEVPLLDSLELAAPASGNVYIEDLVLGIADDIERGVGIAQAFRDYDVFGGVVLQMISSGEESGELDELLMSAAEYFDRLLDDQIQRTTALINPVLTVFIGLFMAGMVIGVFLPVFNMGKGVN